MIAEKQNVKDYTAEEIAEIVERACDAAYLAASTFFEDRLGGEDRYACGFAWVEVYDVKLSTRVGKALAANGLRKNYGQGLMLWNPSKFPCQNIDTLEEGARAAAEVLKRYGFRARAASRLD